MPVSVVVGGQYGSEGKGKVAACLAKEMNASAVVRCGGSNSGHTVYDDIGRKYVFRQLPTACIQTSILNILSAGTYIDTEILLREIELSKICDNRLCIDPFAVVIQQSDIDKEAALKLKDSIGSTGSGTGAAVVQRILRNGNTLFAKDIPLLSKYIGSTKELIHGLLVNNKRIILEGTQGFGLSLIHSTHYPYVTSRDTTAAGFISECGISPLDVDDIMLVLRTFPIRVSGNSGPLINEISWDEISSEAGVAGFAERTSVTDSIRRVGRFDAEIVKEAIQTNRPTRIALNHIDYIPEAKQIDFIRRVESSINFSIDWIGRNPYEIESFSLNRTNGLQAEIVW